MVSGQKKVLVTVGSTLFQDLSDAVLQPAFLRALATLGYTSMVVQYGSAKPAPASDALTGISIETTPYIRDIDEVFASSDLIISHAGSGSILSGLKMGKQMIVVPNAKLMDNHQVELAEVLQRERYLTMSTVGGLIETLSLIGKPLTPFPASEPARFRRLVDDLF